MIVKNEAHIIEKTLANILSYIPIDYWVISDTGSSDKTRTIIRDFFEKRNIPGELTEHDWQNFAHNRNKALECASGKSEYFFIFDADDEINGQLILPENLNTFDQYLFYFDKHHTYARPLLINNQKKWKWTGVLHEYLAPLKQNEAINRSTLEGDYFFVSGRSGARSKNPNKYLDDALMLENGFLVEEKRDPGLAARYAFYCGQSYKDQGKKYHDQSIQWYKKCLDLQNWVQEKYMACFYLGEMYKEKKDYDSALKYLYKSVEYDLERIECIAVAMTILRATGKNLLVNALYHRFKDYQHVLYGKLFLKPDFYQNYEIEYNNAISAFYVNDKQSGYVCCKKIITNYETICQGNIGNIVTSIKNIAFYPDQLKTDTDILSFFYHFDDLLSKKHGEINMKEASELWSKMFEIVRPELTKAVGFTPENKSKNKSKNKNAKKGAVQVFLSFTTCKRVDLFQQTVNSLLIHCTDISLVDYWYCVDDNSSEKDRVEMRNLYPWIDFYEKTPAEKGHRQSMNLIYDKMVELAPTYWIHLEDDFLFHRKMDYVGAGIRGLVDLSGLDVKQVVFNKNYAETVHDYILKGESLSPVSEYVLHQHNTSDTPSYVNCHYWPHYSFRPAMIDVSTILQLGNFDSSNQFFEMDYANKWSAAGHKTAFLNCITHRHIGRLTSEQGDTSKPNAYQMNEEKQFDNNNNQTTPIIDQIPSPTIQVKTSCPIKIVNLKRRQDRRKKTEEILASCQIHNYEFVEAVDGKIMNPTEELAELFRDNDFSSKCGVIGCALSHVGLWKRLVEDPDNSYYLIMEDDFTVCQDFKKKMESLMPNFINKDTVFLGYSMFEKERSKVKSVYENDKSLINVYPLNGRLYIGGTFMYSINKKGAKKLLDYIAKNGIKHGIDYIMKIAPELHSYECQPQLVFSQWNEDGRIIDTDIQNSHDCIDFSNVKNATDNFSKQLSENYVFYPNVDHIGDDLYYHKKPIKELMDIADGDPNCIGFNTLGFFKNTVDTENLVPSRYFKENDGIYVKKTSKLNIYPSFTCVKMLCNWTTSEKLCKEWSNMCEDVAEMRWKNIQLTWTNNKSQIDYYVIINKPLNDQEYYDPKRTVLFQMEPWVNDTNKPWGVKTWGKWAEPDPNEFLGVYTHKTHLNNIQWQISIPNETDIADTRKLDKVASICSSKNYDTGHNNDR